MARGWRYTKLSLSSVILLFFSGTCFVLLLLSFCRFCFVGVSVFMLALELRRCSSDLFRSSRPHIVIPDWQPRIILLGMIEARSVNVNIYIYMYTHTTRGTT